MVAASTKGRISYAEYLELDARSDTKHRRCDQIVTHRAAADDGSIAEPCRCARVRGGARSALLD